MEHRNIIVGHSASCCSLGVEDIEFLRFSLTPAAPEMCRKKLRKRIFTAKNKYVR